MSPKNKFVSSIQSMLRGGSPAVSRRFVLFACVMALSAAVVVPLKSLGGPPAREALQGTASPSSSPSPTTAPGAQDGDDVSPTPSTVSAGGGGADPSPARCRQEDVEATAKPRAQSYPVYEHHEGPWDPSAKHIVRIDVSVTNRGPECVFFAAVGDYFRNEKPESGAGGDPDNGFNNGCLGLWTGLTRIVLRSGTTFEHNVAWRQTCGQESPNAAAATRPSPGQYRYWFKVCTAGDCSCLVENKPLDMDPYRPGCTDHPRDVTLATASFALTAQEAQSSSTPVPTAVPST